MEDRRPETLTVNQPSGSVYAAAPESGRKSGAFAPGVACSLRALSLCERHRSKST